MERFAFKIDNALKANLYKICRLCGNDQPFMQPIVTMESNKTAENANDPSLCKKIFQLIGFTVHKHDNMPQSACTACVDKINDFFEFREMCISTDTQTRKLLGLKTDTNHFLVQRGRKRKSEELTIKTEDEKKKKIGEDAMNQNRAFHCNICNEKFSTGQKFHTHLVIKHSPNVPRYACYACDHTIYVSSEVKNHEMWHKVSKTPFVCGFCNAKLMNKHAHTKHLRLHTQIYTPEHRLVPDITCPHCLKKFPTIFLFNYHECALKTLQCGGCNRVSRQEGDLLRHLPKCLRAYKIYNKNIPAAAASMPTVDSKVHIKNENVVDSNIAAQDAMINHNKNDTSENNLKRINDMLSYTMQTLVSIKSEPSTQIDMEAQRNEQHGEEYQFQNDAHHNDDDDDDNNDDNANNVRISEPIVKLEVGDTSTLPLPRLKIKREHGTLNSCLLNGQELTQSPATTVEANSLDTNKNITAANNDEKIAIKMPLPGLVRIKQERLDEYEVQQAENNQQVPNNNSTFISNLLVVKPEPMDTTCLQIANVTSGVPFCGALANDKIDVKPNREELDRLINMNNSNLKVDLSLPRSLSQMNDKNTIQDTSESFANTIIKTEPTNDHEIIPKISLVSCGVNMSELDFRIKTEIKSEPCDCNENEKVDGSIDWQAQEHRTDNVRISECNIKQEKDKNCDTLVEISIKQEKCLSFENATISATTDSIEITEQLISNDAETVDLIVNANSMDKSIDSNTVDTNSVDNNTDFSTVDANAGTDGNTVDVSADINSADKSTADVSPLTNCLNDIINPSIGVLSADTSSVNKSTDPSTKDANASIESINNTDYISANGDANTVTLSAYLNKIAVNADLHTVDVSAELAGPSMKINSTAAFTIDLEKIDESKNEIPSIDLETEENDCQEIFEPQAVGSWLETAVCDVINLIDDSDNEIESEKADETDKEVKTSNINKEEQNLSSISVEIVEKDASIDNDQPPIAPSAIDGVHNEVSIYDTDSLIAEQQNAVNQQRHSDMIVELNSEIGTDENSSKSNTIEVTENVFNERVDAVAQSPQAVLLEPEGFIEQAAQSVRFVSDRFLFDNSNINEIAENNNNANIERELLEVNAAAASETSPTLPLE